MSEEISLGLLASYFLTTLLDSNEMVFLKVYGLNMSLLSHTSTQYKTSGTLSPDGHVTVAFAKSRNQVILEDLFSVLPYTAYCHTQAIQSLSPYITAAASGGLISSLQYYNSGESYGFQNMGFKSEF